MGKRGHSVRERFLRWRGSGTPFAMVTSFAAFMIGASGLLDAGTPSGGKLGDVWTWIWTAVALAVAAVPLVLGPRFPRKAGFIGALIFVAVTAWQMYQADESIVSVNNLVLYPMLGCYLGWFYGRSTARGTVLAAFLLSGAALLSNPFGGLIVTWFNLGFASAFCLEAAGYLRRKLDHEIQTDPLTGALNRTGLQLRIERELKRHARTGDVLHLVVLDVDDFKAINDADGHATGDRVLVDLVRSARTALRGQDVIARIGGDEFVLLLPDSDLDTVAGLLRAVADLSGDICSHGIAMARPDDDAASLIHRADVDLYRSKRTRKQDQK